MGVLIRIIALIILAIIMLLWYVFKSILEPDIVWVIGDYGSTKCEYKEKQPTDTVNLRLKGWKMCTWWHHIQLIAVSNYMPSFPARITTDEPRVANQIWGCGDDTFVFCEILHAPLASLCLMQMDGSTATLFLLINMTYPLLICREWGRGTWRWRYEGMINCGSVRPFEKWSRLFCSSQSSPLLSSFLSSLRCLVRVPLWLTSFLSAPSPLFLFPLICVSLSPLSLSLSPSSPLLPPWHPRTVLSPCTSPDR